MVGPTPFLNKLFALVNDISIDDLIRWENNGKDFIITEPIAFSRDILPLYFKHNNFSSFVRQLNQYGFKKRDPHGWIFGHENFKFGQYEQLSRIIRKKRSKKNSFISYLQIEGDQMKIIGKEINILKESFKILINDFNQQSLIQEQIWTKQKDFEKKQTRLETEINQLKGLFFDYFSKIFKKGKL